MTMQVAMIGSDGWVLASDRNAQFPPRATSLTAKIKFSADWACACWGDECAQIVADRLVADLTSGKLPVEPLDEAYLRNVSEKVWRSEYQSQHARPKNQRLSAERVRGVILLTRDRADSIVDLSIGRQSTSRVLKTRFIGGDRQNPSTLFVERYYAPNVMTVASLTQLAAHTVLRARDFNHEFIDDAQIVILSGGKISELDAKEIGKLKSWSRAMDQFIGKSLCQPASNE